MEVPPVKCSFCGLVYGDPRYLVFSVKSSGLCICFNCVAACVSAIAVGQRRRKEG